ncbi:MAG TPA: hypothetical protein VEV41_11510 [Terriglobales bacterium]|nr:hypothetical protein [Terriglobales bacterium]
MNRVSIVAQSNMVKIASVALVVLAILFLAACGGGGSPPPPPPPISVAISGSSDILYTGASRSFTASVTNSRNPVVTWSVVETNGGTITRGGVYTAPSLPGTFTIKASSQADPTKSATASVPVMIHVGHPPGYDVGVDYHATGTDFQHTAFIKIYDQPGVRDTVRGQLQGIADRGATIIFTRIWMVTNPGETDFGESWRTPSAADDVADRHRNEMVDNPQSSQASF